METISVLRSRARTGSAACAGCARWFTHAMGLAGQQFVLTCVFEHREIDAGAAFDLHAIADPVEFEAAVERVEFVGQSRQSLVELVRSVAPEKGVATPLGVADIGFAEDVEAALEDRGLLG